MKHRSRVFIFANPLSGHGQAGRVAEELANALRGHYEVTIITEPATSLPHERLAADPRRDCALVVGGDGTLRAVVSAYQAHSLAAPPLLPIPMGTANLMGQFLGISCDRSIADRIVRTIDRRRILLLDAATANGGPCLLIASAGIDAAVVHILARGRSGPIRKSSYFVPALKALGTYSFPEVNVMADGQTIFPARPGVVFIGNIPQYGAGFSILPDARPDDGLLDVAVFPCASPPDVVELMVRIVAGEQLLAEGVACRKARSITVTSSSNVPVQVDGEAAGFTPLTVELMPDRLPFLEPI